MASDRLEELISIMSEIRPDVNFRTETSLIDDQILDSFDIISIVTEANNHFDVTIRVDDLVPDNFNSAAALLELIDSLDA